ncbi:MAG: hypothetical protein RIR26_1977 [Pseudomonadota bacterium]|jgi:hypothetical protein
MMMCRIVTGDKKKIFIPVVLGAFTFLSCKPRSYNESQASSVAKHNSTAADALAAHLVPLWPIPKSAEQLKNFPAAKDLGVSDSLLQRILENAFTDESSGRARALSSPECAQAPSSWRVTAARLSLYEVDLPGNVTSWQTLALQRESDLAQRVELHVTVQPWCLSTRLGRDDFVHSLDHALLFTFDLNWKAVSAADKLWLDAISDTRKMSPQLAVPAETKILPYARRQMDISTSTTGRSTLVAEWKKALRADELSEKNLFPDGSWFALKQSLAASGSLKTNKTAVPAHPTLVTQPTALNGFFKKYVSESNLIRVRSHTTEGLGSAQSFQRWDLRAGKLVRVPLQTTAAQWDRAANTMNLSPLLQNPRLSVALGNEELPLESNRVLLRDVDTDATPMATDLPSRELISLNEKILDFERTSVHTTRCVSCHALDEAQTFAKEERSVVQRGLTPLPLTLMGVSIDSRITLNLRSLRQAEADAARFVEESEHVTQTTSKQQ